MPPLFLRKTLLLVLLACSTSPFAFAQQDDVALPLIIHAEQGDPQHPWWVTSTKQAYLAAFIITPESAAITLVYPSSFQPDEQVPAGELRILAEAPSYRLYRTSKEGPNSGLLNQSERRSRTAGTQYLLVIASEEPFNFSPLELQPRDFRRRLSMSAYTVEPYVAHITEQMVPKGQGFKRRLVRL